MVRLFLVLTLLFSGVLATGTEKEVTSNQDQNLNIWGDHILGPQPSVPTVTKINIDSDPNDPEPFLPYVELAAWPPMDPIPFGPPISPPPKMLSLKNLKLLIDIRGPEQGVVLSLANLDETYSAEDLVEFLSEQGDSDNVATDELNPEFSKYLWKVISQLKLLQTTEV